MKRLLELRGRLRAVRFDPALGRDPRVFVRILLGSLLLANLVAAAMLLKPWGGSAEDLERQIAELRSQVQRQQAALDQSSALVSKVAKARTEGDQFLSDYFADRRVAYSSVVAELQQLAKIAGMQPKEHSFASEPVEGSEDLEMMTITGNYEGRYADLIEFIAGLDRSPRFLIVESLNAAPQQGGGGMLNVSLKVNAFVREEFEELQEMARQ